MIKIAICDDNRIELEKAVMLVNRWADRDHVKIEVKTFDNGDSLIDEQKTNPADLILLDIMMPLLNGMETARELRKIDSAVVIVFLTSSPEFAIESYDVKARGYVLKPVEEEKLNCVLTDCVLSMNREPENIVIKTHFGYQKIYIDKIECIEAQNRRVCITLDDGSTVEGIDTFTNLTESFVSREDFFKCHRSYIVSIDNVDKFTSTEILTKGGKIVPIARGYGKLFKEAYFAYMFKRGKG